VSHNTPRLWDIICIHGDNPTVHGASTLLNAFAARSRSHPLHMLVKPGRYLLPSTACEPTRPLELAVSLHLKLQLISLELMSNACETAGLPVANVFPFLTSLSIMIGDSYRLSGSHLSAVFNIFETLPVLRHLSINSYNTTPTNLGFPGDS
jgi:hypothetical protein